MKRLIVDMSSVIKRCLFASEDAENGKKVEFNGKEVQVNSGVYGYDNAINSIVACLETLNMVPADMILVVESGQSKSRRQQIYKGYKEAREERPPELNAAYGEALDLVVTAMRNLGATVVTQPHIEADDVIAYLARNLKGAKVIFSEDGDLATLLGPDVSLYRQGRLVSENPYGPFEPKFIPLMKSLVGDGNEYKGAAGFGPKAWLDLLVNYGNYLGALETLIRDRRLEELEDDAKEFKPFRKVIGGAAHVYESYQCALLHDEWVNQPGKPWQVQGPIRGAEVQDYRLHRFGAATSVVTPNLMMLAAITAPEDDTNVERRFVAFDSEIIGDERPVFLTCAQMIDTGEQFSFWAHKPGDMAALAKMLSRKDLTWVSFNGINFDAPINALAVFEASDTEGQTQERVCDIKAMAQAIIVENVKPWELGERFTFRELSFDHIDLAEPAPGVRISLKAYAARLAYKTMVDMPFAHDQDLTEDQLPDLERYCFNDLGVTIELFNALRPELELRAKMGAEYGVELRSKSDAQVAEAVLRSVLGIRGRVEREIPRRVRYTPPSFIQTDSEVILDLIEKLSAHEFVVNYANGSPEAPSFLDEPIELGHGTYKVGIGGLHSTHDKSVFKEATQFRSISDFDVASYYPNIMMNAGILPTFGGDADLGKKFIDTYRNIYERRVAAKRSGDKSAANTLKIVLNGTFGKLGSPYSAFYDPALMLGVTITGQLNLMCLIHELEKLPGVLVLSANTDGVMVSYGNGQRDNVLKAIADNATRTGFEYEETPYAKVAAKDLNNYVAITAEKDAAIIKPGDVIELSKSKGGKAKRKGLYASSRKEENPLFLMKNPTMEVCSRMAIDYLIDGTHPREAIAKYTEMRDFVAVRSVKGGGIQPDAAVLVDDWVLVVDNGSAKNLWMRQKHIDEGFTTDDKCVAIRKSKPHPVEEYIGGEPFGRLARWYMTTEELPPIVYASNRNKVPKTEGAKICLTLPDELPADLDREWYINETLEILATLGVQVTEEVATTE